MKFKCKHTGQVYEFLVEHDIKEMLKHSEYSALPEALPEAVEAPAKAVSKKQAKEQ
jgi:hypothetical protein